MDLENTTELVNNSELNDRINLRINSKIKAEFEKICKENNTTTSREIKNFISRVVKDGHLRSKSPFDEFFRG